MDIVSPLLRRAYLYLEDERWDDAYNYFEKVLDREPENYKAYMGRLLVSLKVKSESDIVKQNKTIDDSDDYKKIMRFADKEYAEKVRNYNNEILYRRLVEILKSAVKSKEFDEAENVVEKIKGYKDADSLANLCKVKADIARKDEKYDFAIQHMHMENKTISNYEQAISLFKSLDGWKDSKEKIDECTRKIEECVEKDKELAQKLAAEQRKGRIARLIFLGAIIAVFILSTLYSIFIKPEVDYNSAIKLMETDSYAAMEAFIKLDGYEESEKKAVECAENFILSTYEIGMQSYNNKHYNKANESFRKIILLYDREDITILDRECWQCYLNAKEIIKKGY